jgi:hypothetical protein
MSHDATRTRTSPSALPLGGPAPLRTLLAEVVPPQAPLFTVRTDEARGTVRTRGRLDRVGAELLSRAVLTLRQLGHRQITVHLESAASDAEALLTDLAERLSAEGVDLVLR